MKYKDYYITRISALLNDLDADSVEAVYLAVADLAERSSRNGRKKPNKRDSRSHY